jgi:hypothetical protein
MSEDGRTHENLLLILLVDVDVSEGRVGLLQPG